LGVTACRLNDWCNPDIRIVECSRPASLAMGWPSGFGAAAVRAVGGAVTGPDGAAVVAMIDVVVSRSSGKSIAESVDSHVTLAMR
jgi:hypothetical protein